MTINMVHNLLKDEQLAYGYLTGVAGTGKTTTVVELCEQLHKEGVTFKVVAYTHKACGVLAEKFPMHLRGLIQTLDSFLSKRPTINENATSRKNLEGTIQTGGAEDFPRLLIVDEFSMLGERDLQRLGDFVDPLDESIPGMKILFVGDPYQLQPIKDQLTLRPRKPYWVNLAKVHRTDKPDLQAAMSKMVEGLEHNKEVSEPLDSTNIKRLTPEGFATMYTASNASRKVLCFTNKGVEHWNARLQGRSKPEIGDVLFNSTLKEEVTLVGILKPCEVRAVEGVLGPLEEGSKYKTLEFMKTLAYLDYYIVINEEGKQYTLATVFGMSTYLDRLKSLADKAITLNKEVAKLAGGPQNITYWCNNNRAKALAKDRNQVWREYLTLKNSTMHVDFNHALTVHKSQGSTFQEVYIDEQDLSKCKDIDYKSYLRLYYVALSRASERVYIQD